MQWRKQLDQEALSSGGTPNRGEAAYRRVAGELRQLVWDPLLTHLANATHVFVVPDGSLHLVSFAALPTGASQYLVDAGPVIHHLSAERDLVPMEAGRAARACSCRQPRFRRVHSSSGCLCGVLPWHTVSLPRISVAEVRSASGLLEGSERGGDALAGAECSGADRFALRCRRRRTRSCSRGPRRASRLSRRRRPAAVFCIWRPMASSSAGAVHRRSIPLRVDACGHVDEDREREPTALVGPDPRRREPSERRATRTRTTGCSLPKRWPQ